MNQFTDWGIEHPYAFSVTLFCIGGTDRQTTLIVPLPRLYVVFKTNMNQLTEWGIETTAPCIGEAFERKHMLRPSAGVLLLINQAIPAPCKVSRSSSRVAARLGGWSAGV